MDLLQNGAEDLVTKNMEEAEVLNPFFTSLGGGGWGGWGLFFRNPGSVGPVGKSRVRESYPRWRKTKSGNT